PWDWRQGDHKAICLAEDPNHPTDNTISLRNVKERAFPDAHRARRAPHAKKILDTVRGPVQDDHPHYLDQLVGLKTVQLINARSGTRARPTRTAGATTSSAPSRTKISN